MIKQRLRVGGVPEHFNLPWQQALEQGSFAQAGLAVDFVLYPTGTGAMCEDLRKGRLDLAVLLTEGAVTDIHQQGGHRLIGAYVTTPLIWGVHVAATSPYHTLADFNAPTFAISRPGSGSHLMALLLARRQGWNALAAPVVVGGLAQLEQALCLEQAEVFLWEKYTTLARVKAGFLRCIDELPTPWPAFVIAARTELLETCHASLQCLLAVLYQHTTRLMAEPARTCQLVAERFALTADEARAWFDSMRWATAARLDPHMLEQVILNLSEAGILTVPQLPVGELIATSF
jgi:sulfonate transport system substrate-binding protein